MPRTCLSVRALLLLFGAPLSLLAACDDAAPADAGPAARLDAGPGPGTGVDAGPPMNDAGLGADAGLGSDAGPALTDAGVAGSDGGAATADPALAGPATLETLQVDAPAASGSLPVTVYLPAGSTAAPLVLFHHGFQLTPANYVSYGEHLASWGYAVLMPRNDGGPGGLLGGSPTHRELADDVRALLDWAQSGPPALAGRVDASRIGLSGHSLGGKIAFLVASEDPRVDAVFGVDAVDSAGGPLGGTAADYPSVTPERMSQITVPFVSVGETTNATCAGPGCMPCAPADQNFQRYFEHAAGPALEIEVIGANHVSFLDNPMCGLACLFCDRGTDDPRVTRALTRSAMTAFFEVALRGDRAFERHLTGADMAADEAAGRVTTRVANGF